MVDVEARAKLLADAYRYQRHIDALEDEISAHTGGTIPAALVNWVHSDARAELGRWVAGTALLGCPWDSGDEHRLRRAMGRFWHEVFDDYLDQYRTSAPYRGLSPRLIDEYQADDWNPVRH